MSLLVAGILCFVFVLVAGVLQVNHLLENQREDLLSEMDAKLLKLSQELNLSISTLKSRASADLSNGLSLAELRLLKLEREIEECGSVSSVDVERLTTIVEELSDRVVALHLGKVDKPEPKVVKSSAQKKKVVRKKKR